MIKKLSKCVREYKKPVILTLIFIILEAILECIVPFITARLVNQIEAGISIKAIIWTGAILVMITLASFGSGVTAGITSAKASAGFSKNLRHDMFHRIQNYSFENVDKFSSSSLVTRLTTDVNNVQMSFMMLIRIAVRAPMVLIFSAIMAAIMGGALAATLVVIIPILAFGIILITKNAMPAFKRVFRKYDRLNESIEENVTAMRVVKGFSREEFEKQKFNNAAEDIRRDFTKAERIVALNAPLMQFCVYVNMILVLFLGSYLVVKYTGSYINVGEISAMLTYGMQILMQLQMLSMIYVMLTMSAESARRINEVLDEEATLTNPENPSFEIADGSIEFDAVNFKYSKNAKLYALKDINLHIRSGMTVGILGGTGSGKSSFVQLIPRLYDTTTGCVKVGGRDVREYDLKTLRDSVAMVLQKNLLFSGTIKENLRWGNENATDEEIEQAAKLAQAHDFVISFPEGYDTFIEQGGSNVSGGQKQRLCIARALLKNPKILILDDSTSAVDTKTDAFIREGFKNFIPDTTKIIIAQRVASVCESDLIIIFNNGTIEAAGTHSELMETCEIYRDMYNQQTGGADNE